MKKYRVGLVGCGGRQRRGHMPVFQGMPEVEVVACADFVEELRNRFAKEFGIPRKYPSAEEMFAAEDLDIATVVTAPKWRVVPVTQAAEAGVRGIICEKPFSIDLEEVDVMSEACRKSGSRLVINHQSRFFGPVARVKQAIESGEIGEVEYYKAVSRGKIHGQGTHVIDLVRYLHGEKPFAWAMGSVSGTDTFDAKIPGPDEDAAVLAFEDGTHLYLECGRQTPGFPEENPPVSVDAVGTRGRAYLGRHGARYRIWAADGKYLEETNEYGVENKKGQTALVRELIESIETGKEHRNSAEISRPTQEAMVAVIQSAVERRRVTFPIKVPPKYLSIAKKKLTEGT